MGIWLQCVFRARQLDYLGFQISKGTIQPGKKVKAIYPFPRPANQHEVRRNLDLAGYFKRFIVIYAKIAIPLTQLTKKNIQFTWGKEQEETFAN